MRKEFMYKGVFFTLLISGMFEYYSMTEQRFIKADWLDPIHQAIEVDLEKIGEVE